MIRSPAPLDYRGPPSEPIRPSGCRSAFFGALLGLPTGFGLLAAMGSVIGIFWPSRHTAPYGAVPVTGLAVFLLGCVLGALGKYFWGGLSLGAGLVMTVLGTIFAGMAGIVC